MGGNTRLETSRTDLKIYPDHKRVIGTFLHLGDKVATAVLDELSQWSTSQCEDEFAKVIGRFKGRHRDLPAILRRNYEHARSLYEDHPIFQEEEERARKRMLATYFTCEYSIESAALFNPSIVRAPDQSGLKNGELRCILSLRAVGEGHISSIAFRELLIRADDGIELLPGSRMAELPAEYGDETESGYRLRFDPESALAQRTLFPRASWEWNGMEDARFVHFENEGSSRYMATYTAYDGRQIRPAWISTRDFLSFELGLLSGSVAKNKNFAFFPRPVNGKYAMLSRLDGRNNYIVFSDQLLHWEEPALLQGPEHPWELIKSGNCGSPIETDAGWLVITHGVGPMRRYCLGAMLLDLDDPTRVIGRLTEPLLEPGEEEREGYVPNVLYSCGSIIHGDRLLLPYAASDRYCSLAVVDIRELLDRLTESL